MRIFEPRCTVVLRYKVSPDQLEYEDDVALHRSHTDRSEKGPLSREVPMQRSHYGIKTLIQ